MTAEDLAALWSLDDQVIFLNHGSFGACPTAVIEHRHALHRRLERQPVQMLWRDLPALMDSARQQLADFLSVDPAALVFVTNATTGVSTVLRSLSLAAGDELLVTDHAYGACRNALEFVAGNAGATVVVASVPFPNTGPQALLDAVLERVTARTRLALFDHVASPTGLVFPVQELTAALRQRGVLSLIDGAHAPGMLELQLDALGADYYVGNCHKWLCAPKTSGFIAVASEHRASLRPLVISHGASRPEPERFRAEFDWVGTSDPTPMLCVPEAIRVLGAALPGGWPALRARNHSLALSARRLLCDALELEPPCPDELVGSMVALPLPQAPGNPFELHGILLREHGIEVQLYPRPQAPRLLRVSCQLYNRLSHYQALADALPAALAAERRRQSSTT